MVADPIEFFSDELLNGKKLCILPIARMHAEEPVWLSEWLVFYPAKWLEASSFNIAWEPKREWDAFLAKNHAIHPEWAHAEGDELNWIKSAATNVTADDIFQGGVLAFPIDMEWEALLGPESHEAHLCLIATAAAHAEEWLSLVRLYYCRIDLPETLPEHAGLLENKQFSAALFYTIQDNESYIIAGDCIRQRFVTGLGLEVRDVSVRTSPPGEVFNLANHALRMHTQALEAANDTSKFIILMNLLEFLAHPSDYMNMVKVKGKIARHVARTRVEYDEIIEDFKFLTSLKDDNGKNVGLRENIIHNGRRLEDLLSQPQCKEVLIRMERYASIVIKDFLRLSDQTWAEVEKYRLERGKELNV
tara:strand:+ start:3334 stop:4416 length:1083 start_codon:yes stop_codon:yes gene_type:complete